MTEKKIKQVCECTNCGNESEMVITCHIEEEADEAPAPKPEEKKKVKGHGVCTTCGNEADMWVDL